MMDKNRMFYRLICFLKCHQKVRAILQRSCWIWNYIFPFQGISSLRLCVPEEKQKYTANVSYLHRNGKHGLVKLLIELFFFSINLTLKTLILSGWYSSGIEHQPMNEEVPSLISLPGSIPCRWCVGESWLMSLSSMFLSFYPSPFLSF